MKASVFESPCAATSGACIMWGRLCPGWAPQPSCLPKHWGGAAGSLWFMQLRDCGVCERELWLCPGTRVFLLIWPQSVSYLPLELSRDAFLQACSNRRLWTTLSLPGSPSSCTHTGLPAHSSPQGHQGKLLRAPFRSPLTLLHKALRWLPTAPHSQQQPTTTTPSRAPPHAPFSLCLCPPILPSSPLLRHVECLLTCGRGLPASPQDRLLWIISPEASLPQRALPWSVSAAAPTSPHLLCLLHVTLSTSPLRGSIQGHCSAGHHASVGHRGTPSLSAYLLTGIRHNTCQEVWGSIWFHSDQSPPGICGSKGFFVFLFQYRS